MAGGGDLGVDFIWSAGRDVREMAPVDRRAVLERARGGNRFPVDEMRGGKRNAGQVRGRAVGHAVPPPGHCNAIPYCIQRR
jgi:hypothetical protein